MELALHYHLMHPGEDSAPGDPNAALYLDGTYHLHYILRYPDHTGSFSFVHVTSQDMLNWTWHKTTLQPSFTGHGMFSGTGFITKEGKPAIIYHGQASGRNQIVLAKDPQISGWETPYAVEPKTADGKKPEIHHWDPDCFIIDDTYYAISGGENPPLMRSPDLSDWVIVGDFLKHDLPDVAVGEDISCPNFFPMGDRWMLLCISHQFGFRYYIGDWDPELEHFVPQTHGRMNWRRPEQPIFEPANRDFFAPESVRTPDGRRVMWAWLATLDKAIDLKSIQSLPRELSLTTDGDLRIKPLTELQSLRGEKRTLSDIAIDGSGRIATLEDDAVEILLTVDRRKALRRRFGVRLFAGEQQTGLPIMVHPETGTLRVGDTEAPFRIADLPEDGDVELRIYVDKYLVEVFANDRQAIVAAYMDYKRANGLYGYSFGGSMNIKRIETWPIKATNRGFFEARESRIWEPQGNT